jgi:hypothetical protein
MNLKLPIPSYFEAMMSGMKVNFAKSEAFAIGCDRNCVYAKLQVWFCPHDLAGYC